MSGQLADLFGGVGAVTMRAGVVFINVWDCRADVMRFYATGAPDTWAENGQEIASECAANSDELSDEAAAAVAAQGGRDQPEWLVSLPRGSRRAGGMGRA